MGNRYEQRTSVSLSVLVSGVDQHGNAFTQSAEVTEISRRGARLREIRCLQPATTVQIKHNSLAAQFRVEWVGTPGTDQDGQAGLRALEPARNLWKRDLPPPAYDLYEPPTEAPPKPPVEHTPRDTAWNGIDRRRSSRIPLNTTVRVQVEGSSFPIWAELSDISLGGCYVRLLAPLVKGSKVTLTLSLEKQSVTVKGHVVTSDPGVGAGIQFNLEPNEMVDIWRSLRKLGSKLNRSESVQNEV